MTSATRGRLIAQFQRLRRISNHPAMLFGGALALLVSSLHEIVATAEDFEVGAHHGVFVYALLLVSRTFPDLLDSLVRAEEATLEVVGAEPHADD